MASRSPERPARRAATRRKTVVDEEDGSDVENTIISQTQNEDEGKFTPAPAKTTRASPRRKTAGDITPRRRTTGRRPRASELVEPSQIFSPPESVADEPHSPTKRSPPKRRSVKDARTARKSRTSRISIASDATELEPPLPTPEPSASPEPRMRQSTPLSDITDYTINEQTPKPAARNIPPLEYVTETTENVPTPKTEIKMKVEIVDAQTTKLERPMDIVVKTRALGIPQSQEPAVPKARMTITYLVLTNFKSYAGRQEVGPFHASFSSVVGPNGSGKSNVIDSLLFVFGFRASKMRQGKISALIHNSAQFPDLDYCEVEVYFQEVMDQADGTSTVVPNSGMIVSRRAFKNNSSKYYIDGRTSDFTTVTTMLKDRGIDLDHKRFLILQGEVESIAQMKPKAANDNDDGLLEYLEDIIGTSKYKTPIEESAAETETLNEVCLEKNGRVQHVEKEKNALEDKKNKALAFIKDENDLATKQSALYQVYVAECGDNIQVTDEAIGQIQQQLNDELQKHQGGEDGIKQLEKAHRSAARELEKLEKDTQGILKEMAKLDKETVKFEEKKKFLSNKAKKLEKALETSNFGTAESKMLAKNAEDDINRITTEMNVLEQEAESEDTELAKIRESLKGKTQGISDDIAAKQKQLEPWSAKVNDKQSAIAVAQSELDILHERENSSATAVAEIEAKITGFHELRQTKAAELETCEKQRKTAEKQIQSTRKQLEQLVSQEPALKAKLSGAREKADEARASLSATQSQGNVLASLNRLKESGRIDGFHGRLGNLGAIDQKYDVAISTACPQLDNLVVDTTEVGQQCVEYLRKNNLGRAQFILLDKLPQRDLSPKETPENVPRLFDLVKSKHQRFAPAFYHVLQDALIAKDLEQANRIAYGAKRWRVVTLDGQLIDKSGTMSGGGTKVVKGGMSSKLVADVTKEQVAKLDVDRDALEKEFSRIQEQRQELEGELKELQTEVPKLETQKQKFGLEVDSIERNISDAQKRIKEIGAEAEPSKIDRTKTAELEKSIAKMQKEVETLQAETAGIEEEIADLQNKIMEIGGVKLRGQKAKVDGLREQVSTLNESLNSAEVAKAKAAKQGVKHEKASSEASKELEKVKADLQTVDEDASAQNNDSSGFRKKAEEAQQSLEFKKEELHDLKAQLDTQTAHLNESRGLELELRNNLSENQKVLADNNKRLKYWEEKLSKLSLQNVAEDGEERDPEPMPELSRDEISDLDKEDLKAAIALLEERTSAHVELAVLAEYRRRVTEHATRLEDLQTALAARDVAKKRTDDLRRLRLEGFMQGFSTISSQLKNMYQMITMGGNAELELVDSLDPFSEGILFSVMPPKKSWKNIGNLSGGEKTLSSLALVFALHHYKPTPLYVMDEIDAALDFRNVSNSFAFCYASGPLLKKRALLTRCNFQVSIVAAYIKERTKNAQFIVISLRNNMFELASRLVGVYKVNHMVRLASRHEVKKHALTDVFLPDQERYRGE